MERTITGIHQDAAGEWVATLDCGHQRHVRHDPPWQAFPWVGSLEGRRDRNGTGLECLACDREDAYRQAGIQGLCDEGATEAARRRPGRPD